MAAKKAVSAKFYGTGRRKSSVARVRLVAGEGNITVNGRALDEYFDYDTLIRDVKQPLVLTNNENKYDVIVKVEGGGFTGQAGAIRHGISRALLKADEELRGALKKEGFLTRLGKGVGNVVSIFYQAAREAVQTTITNILPFMIFVSLIVGIINGTGVGNWLANTISPLASSLPGMLVISLFCALPFISPLIGPGAVIAQIIGVLLGNQIAQGGIQPQMALPALFAIDAQVGGDFVPVGLSLSEAEAETVEIGVPAVLFSRVITGPVAVVIAYFASFGLF